MKYGIIFLLIITLFSCKKEAQKEFLISNIAHLKETEIYLAYGTGSSVRMDTIKVRGGRFVAMKSPEEAEPMTLYFPQSNLSVAFYGNADSRLTIAGDATMPENFLVQGDSVNNKLSEFRKSVRVELKSMRIAKSKADRSWFADSLKQYESTLFSQQQIQIRAQYKHKMQAFITRNPSTPESLIALCDYLRLTNDYGALQLWWSKLNGNSVKDFSTFLELKKAYKSMLPLTVGRNIAAFQTYDRDNKQAYFYPEQQKKMLVMFWSSADKYSAFLNKKYAAASTQWSKDTVTYVGISLDDSFMEWKKASKDLKGKQIYVRGGFQNESIRNLGVPQTPCLVALGKDTKIAKVYAIGESPLK
jgi:hypothetical protein